MIVMSAAVVVGGPDAAPVARGRARGIAAALVWGIAATVPALVAVDIALHLHTGYTDLTSWWLGDVVLSAVLLVPGALVAHKRPDNAIGWLLCTASLSTGFAGAGREYLAYGVLGGTAPGHLWIGWFTDSLYLLSMATLPMTLMLFPDGHLLSRRARAAFAVPILSVVFGVFGSLFFSDHDGVDVRGHRLLNPARHVFPPWLGDGALALSYPLFLVSVIFAIVLLALRYRRSGVETRLQMKWVVWAGTIGVLELASELLPNNTIAPVTGPIASGLVTAAVCIAILRHRLFDIDVVINRTLVFAALSLLVVGMYLTVVAATSTALGQPMHIGTGLVATAVVAVAFAPVRARLQRSVDRLMYGERRNPYGVMTQLGERLERDDGTGELAVVVQTVTQALKLPYAGLFGPAGELLAESGIPGAAAVQQPLTYQGAPMGHLLVQPRDRARGFDPGERKLLGDLARQIGAAVHAVRLSADLQASRHRLVSAKEEERRRLRRDLHDGLGPKLAALGLKLDAAHALVDLRPEQSKAVLGTVKVDIRETIDDIRRLVYGLRPPALDELGLVAALRECGQRFDAPEVTVRAADLPPLPAAVEVAAYWIVNEALTNVVRHADARRCAVQIWVDERAGTLQAAVSDDGRGLPVGWRPGVGSSSMAERAAELGGTVRVQGGPSGRGTEVVVGLPLATVPQP